MGNITNLATTGNYKTEADGLKVEFYFLIDNEKMELKQFNGTVREVTEEAEDARPDNNLATFNKNEHNHEVRNGVTMTLTRGREVELATAIVNAVAAFEAKIAKGEAVNAVVE